MSEFVFVTNKATGCSWEVTPEKAEELIESGEYVAGQVEIEPAKEPEKEPEKDKTPATDKK